MRNGTRVILMSAALAFLTSACSGDARGRLVGTWVEHPDPDRGMTISSQGEWLDLRDEAKARYEFLDTGEILLIPPVQAEPVIYTVRFSETMLVLTDSSGEISTFKRHDGD
jgi:hypothetical protein